MPTAVGVKSDAKDSFKEKLWRRRSSVERMNKVLAQLAGGKPAVIQKTNSDSLKSYGLEEDAWPESRRCLAHFLHSVVGQAFLGGLIFLNLVIVVLTTDAGVEDQQLATWLQAVDKCLLVLFVSELIARIYVSRLKFFCEVLNWLDISVVLVDLALEILSLAQVDTSMNAARFLRVMRLTRITRAYRVVQMVPTLAGMVRDLTGAMEAVLWGLVLLFFVMTLWSILTVQLIHPLAKELAEKGVFGECDRCSRAYSSVMQANLTFFQQIIAGDSWGLVTIPIMEHYPATAFLFIAVLVSINLAIINVILAVIVESAEQTRRENLVERMNMKEKSFLVKSQRLARLCRSIDTDGSGDVSREELIDAFDYNRDLAMTFHDMGICREDLVAIFDMMDLDKSGKVAYDEFVHFIHRCRTLDETTTLNFIRHHVMETFNMLKESQKVLETEQRAGVAQKTAPDLALSSGEQAEGARPISRDTLSLCSFASEADDERGAASQMSTEIDMPAEMRELRSTCKQILARLDDDLLGALTDISKKCEMQVSLLGDPSIPFSSRQEKKGLGPRADTAPVSELLALPELIREHRAQEPQAYACVFPQCMVMRSTHIREWQPLGTTEEKSSAPPV